MIDVHKVFRIRTPKILDKIIAEDFVPDLNEEEYKEYITFIENCLNIPLIFCNEFWQVYRTHHNHTTDWQLIHTDEQLEKAYNKLEIPFNQWQDVFSKIKQLHRYFYDDKVLQEWLHVVDQGVCGNIESPLEPMYFHVINLKKQKAFTDRQLRNSIDKI